jgi:hypothetical protein
MDETLPENAIIYIGNDKGHPPSLPFYLSQHHPIAEQYHNDSLVLVYRQSRKAGFVLRKDQAEFMQSQLPNLSFTIFHQQLTDRKEQADYYVLVKK